MNLKQALKTLKDAGFEIRFRTHTPYEGRHSYEDATGENVEEAAAWLRSQREARWGYTQGATMDSEQRALTSRLIGLLTDIKGSLNRIEYNTHPVEEQPKLTYKKDMRGRYMFLDGDEVLGLVWSEGKSDWRHDHMAKTPEANGSPTRTKAGVALQVLVENGEG